MRLTKFASMDPHLVLGLVNTALRNDAEDLADLVASHDLEESALREKLLAIGYAYDPGVRQFRAVPDLARISQGSRREAPPDGITGKAREGFQDERYADIP